MRSRWVVILGRTAVFGGAILVWDLLVRTGTVDPFWISRPSDVAEKVAENISTSELWRDVRATTFAATVGLGLSIVLGFVIGACLGASRIARDIAQPVLTIGYSIPRIALAPLFILWFGLGTASKVALTLTVVAFVIVINVQDALVRIDRELVASVQTMGHGRWFVIRYVHLPTAADALFTAVKLGMPLAIAATVVGEMLGSSAGIGRRLSRAASNFDTASLFENLVYVSVIAYLAQQLLNYAERFALRWRVSMDDTTVS